MNPVAGQIAGSAALFVCLSLTVARLKYLLHMLQLEEYDPRRFGRWVVVHPRRLFANEPLDGLGVLGVIVLVARPSTTRAIAITASVTAILGLWGLWKEYRLMRVPAKKPLVMTPRASRLLVCGTILTAAISIVPVVINGWETLFFSILLPILAPVILLVSRYVMEPLESGIRQWYMQDARSKLTQLQPTIIGITGSYGKTSTKYFLTHLLASRFEVLMTPESYNTAMGICRVIREQLGPEHRVFVVELAENEPGGFRRLFSLVRCDMSIVVSVGLQHLEEFGSEHLICDVMRGFVTMDGSGKTVVVNADDSTLGYMMHVPGKRLVRTSTDVEKDADFHAENVIADSSGITFDIVDTQGIRIHCHSSLLGRHNVKNVLLAVAAAREMGISWPLIQAQIKTLQAPPHRLQVLHDAGGVRIIDDAFNANPEGFAMAMDVLASFPSRRVLVTPGLVSLGRAEKEENVQAGRRAAAAADTVVLVGARQTQSLRQGLLSAEFHESSIITANSLQDVAGILRTLIVAGDTVLFENDLPDTYNE